MTSSKILLFLGVALVSISHLGATSIASSLTRGQGETSVKSERLLYEWKIKNFDLLRQKTREYIQSPVFETAEKDLGWKLNLYPQGINKTLNGFASVFLTLHSDNRVDKKTNLDVRAVMGISKAGIIHANQQFYHTYKVSDSFGWPASVHRSVLLPSNSRDDGTFTIHLKIDLSPRIVTVPMS